MKNVKVKYLAHLKSGDAISASNINKNGKFPVFGGNGLRGYTHAKNRSGTFVLIGRQGALCGNVRYVEGDFWASEHAIVATPFKNTKPKWLRYVLHDANLGQYSESAAQPGISVSVVNNVEIPTPPLHTQRQIATYLDKKTEAIDTLIAKKQRMIELLEEKRSALINHVVTKGLNPDAPMKDSGVPWIGEVPAHWMVGDLRRFGEIIDCKHITPQYSENGYPVISTSEVKPGKLDVSRAHRFVNLELYKFMIEGKRQPLIDDIIYSRNASLGSAALVTSNDPFCLGQDVVIIRLDNENALFFNFQLNSPIVLEQVELACVGATFKRINVSQIRKLKVVVPSKGEQIRIATFLKSQEEVYSSSVELVRRQLTKLQEYRQALITAAVTGKIDVTADPMSEDPEEAASEHMSLL